MKKSLGTFCIFITILTGCGNEESTQAPERPEPGEYESIEGQLGTPPPNPDTAVPTPPTTGVNGTRVSRDSLEPRSWLACITKTSSACSTGSGGIGAVCGAAAPCNSDLTCMNGVCASLVGAGGSCSSNFQCGSFAGSRLICAAGTCRAPSGQSGPCDEASDCNSTSLACSNGTCQPAGPGFGQACEAGRTPCAGTSPTGAPLVCYVGQAGGTEGWCQEISGVGGLCWDETACNQATAPRCIPTAPNRTCNVAGAAGALCDDKPDCNQSAPGGLECIANRCQARGGPGATCGTNSHCQNGLACIAGACQTLSGTGGTCDEVADCSQAPGATTCVAGVCRLSGVFGGQCGIGGQCANSSSCITGQNPNGVLACIGDTCACPGSVGTTCFENSDCGLWTNGVQTVCLPNPNVPGKSCNLPNLNTGGCCDEKADCRPINGSTCWLAGGPALACSSGGGQCVIGLPQGSACLTSDQCTGALVCKTLPGRTSTTCEF